MGFFDLNVPYHESDRQVTDKSSLKSRRLKLSLKAMEFGYTGIAYNRTLKGVMSESDRCSTPLFPMSSILKLVPSSSALSAAVKFHRELLNVSVSAPFRQYTRITVIVDSPSQVVALNVGNPVLKSYDIAAVRPLNQNAFDQACQTSEVDIIAIDFSEKLPFRLKQPMVKSAIKRGVYFEITYSGLLGDAQSRRLMISNSKMLVDWTRGKNLIFSSAASSAMELRGPLDVSNLFSLLGLSIEHAKAAISKNCRSLLANALRKKQFYKEAVKVEEIPSHGQVNPKHPAFDEWLKWDPVSSGEGDLLLDDMKKSFSLSNCTIKKVKTIDFTSSMNGMPAHGLQIKDLISRAKTVHEPPDTGKYLSDAMETEVAVSVFEKLEEENGLNTFSEEQLSQVRNPGDRHTLGTEHCGTVLMPECQATSHGVAIVHSASGLKESKVSLDSHPNELVSTIPLSEEGQTSLSDEEIRYQVSCLADPEIMPVKSGTSNIVSKLEEAVLVSSDELTYSNVLEADVVASETKLQDRKSQICGQSVLPDNEQVHIITVKDKSFIIPENHSSNGFLSPSVKSSVSNLKMESNVKNNLEISTFVQEGIVLDQVSNEVINKSKRERSLASSDLALQDICIERREYKEMACSSVTLDDKFTIDESFNLVTNLDEPISENVMGKWKQVDSVTVHQGIGKSLAGGKRRKRNALHQSFLFPFKHFLKPSQCKKTRKLKPLTSI
ncbi:protein GAMETOPHYTE DEFECTIVE 1-like [Primulina huaijiensis]|uniref:protein GAMETOPHYTE DEFECTIVE 1-like n=1 Tax=Primulina huaijiensis TaxID=1492673 RepID=UPI003CC71FEF